MPYCGGIVWGASASPKTDNRPTGTSRVGRGFRPKRKR